MSILFHGFIKSKFYVYLYWKLPKYFSILVLTRKYHNILQVICKKKNVKSK